MFTWPPTDDNYRWFFTLLTIILSSGVGVYTANRLSSTYSRPHNTIKLLNEWLARNQFSFLSFYLILLIIRPIGLTDSGWKQGFMQSLLLASLFPWFWGLTNAGKQDRRLAVTHSQCVATENNDICKLDKKSIWVVLWVNLMLTAITLLLALGIVFSPLVHHAPPVAQQIQSQP